MNISKARELVIEAGRKLTANGLIARTWGNVSCRVDAGHFVITPSGKDYDSLTPEDIVRVGTDSLEYEGDVKPSSEKGIHAGVYKLRPDVNFVIHTHQVHASAVSAADIKSFDTNGRFSLLGDHVLLAGYGLPGTGNLRKNVEKAVVSGRGNALIMKNHGALNYGKESTEAFRAAEQLEKACEDFIKDNFSKLTGNWLFNPIHMGEYIMGRKIEPKGNLEESEDHLVNNSPYVLACSYLDRPLHPYLDDFAQIVGPRMTVVENDKLEIQKGLDKADAVFIRGYGAICRGEDKEAVSLIVEKNCMAYLTAKMISSSAKPINGFESNLMRLVYIKKYSRQMA